MSYNHVRANVRNLLVGATRQEAIEFANNAKERGDKLAESYAREYIAETDRAEGRDW